MLFSINVYIHASHIRWKDMAFWQYFGRAWNDGAFLAQSI